MESRVIFAFFLSLVVLIGWQFIFPTPTTDKTISMPQAQEQSVTQSIEQGIERNAIDYDKPRVVERESPATGVIQTETLENDEIKIVFTNENGGGISEVILKKFYQSVKKKNPYHLFSKEGTDLLFQFLSQNDGCDTQAPALYKKNPDSVILSYACNTAGVNAIYTLKAPYFLTINFEFSNVGAFLGKELFLTFPVNPGRKSNLSSYNVEQVVYEVVDDITRENVTGSEMQAMKTAQNAVNWIAFGDRYFFVGALAPPNFRPVVNSQLIHTSKLTSQRLILQFLMPRELTTEKSFGVEAYLGPKDRSYLEGMGTLNKVVDFGIFKVIAIPIWHFLKYFYEHIFSNFGLAIIILTIFVRLLFLPLTLKGMGSMQAMQKMQPQIKKLRDKFKDDKQKLNQEMVLLLRAHKVNPLGGCLPILIQIPVFIALYAVLGNSVELYQAPFAAWINDLSSKDPFYVLPILLGLSFLIQQKLTPSTVDPQTQKIMMVMPIVFTFFMLNLPSGLNLYIFTSTVLGIIQQLILNKKAQVSV